MSPRLRLIGLLAGAALLLAGCLPTGPPAPSVGRTYTGYSFDACQAPPTSQMSTWVSQSPYRALGVYVGGSSAACKPGTTSNPNLTPGWVGTVEGQGWKLLPIYVGNQAPCTSFSHTINVGDPAGDGAAEADDAVAQAQKLGIGTSSPIYFDMEAYGRDPSCINAVLTFVSNWVARVHLHGYVAGYYSSGASGITDQVNVVANHWPYVVPDELWIAHWITGCSPWPTDTKDSYVPDTMWANHQRHRQFCGGHDENWGGAQINIDGDISDGSVAGL